MSSGNKGKDGPPAADDEDRSLLFGLRKDGEKPVEGREQSRRPPASAASPAPAVTLPAATAVAGSAEPPDAGATLASLMATQQRILAHVTVLTSMLAPDSEDAPDFAEAARKIGAATEWVNDVKAAISEILASTGKQIEGLKSAQLDHDKALAQLKIREEGLDKVVQALDATAKGLDGRSSELEAVKQDLTKYYEKWTAESKTSRDEMEVLSKRLDAGDHMVTRLEGLQKGWTEKTTKAIDDNAAAQRSAAEQTSGNVDKLAKTGDSFLAQFQTGREEALKESRRDWTRTRRWSVPALALALVLAVPVFVVAGALGQSEFVVFEPYDETGGWMEAVWENHGKQVRLCMHNSFKMQQVIPCSFDVDFR